MALVAHGRTDLALPLASAAIEPSRFDEWRHGYRLRTLGYIAAPLLTAYPAQLEQFLSAVVDERWLRQQMRQSTTAALAGAAFALWGALDARLLRNVRDPLMAELGDPRRHDSATDPAGAAGLSLLGAASLFGALPPPHVAAVYARRNLDAILRGRVLESRSETPTVLELQALLGLRAIALRSPASVRLQAEVGEAALRRLTANDGAHTKSRHLNKLLVAWLQRCAAAGWIALADAAPVPE